MKKGKVEEIGRIAEGIRKTGLVAGIGAHLPATAGACEEARLDPDFYMLTVNRVKYCSGEPAERSPASWRALRNRGLDQKSWEPDGILLPTAFAMRSRKAPTLWLLACSIGRRKTTPRTSGSCSRRALAGIGPGRKGRHGFGRGPSRGV